MSETARNSRTVRDGVKQGDGRYLQRAMQRFSDVGGATLFKTVLGADVVLVPAPRSELAAFALIRTRGLVDDIEQIVDPVVGRIIRKGSGMDRSHP
jgi:hypothetical protein